MMRTFAISVSALAIFLGGSLPGAASPQMQARLEARVAAAPADSSARRLLGHVLLEDGNAAAALEHLHAAVEAQPLNAAAQFDYGRALDATGDVAGAVAAWQTAIELAPDSEYALEAQRCLEEAGVEAAAYEIREFPGPPTPEDASGPISAPAPRLPLYARLETGFLYNSNVALSPLSRQLAPGDRESFQLFVAPEIEWSVVKRESWAVGPLFTGYFTLNEGRFSNFNLQSYTPGLFGEATFDTAVGTFVPRLEYRFTLDEYQGSTFAQRHGGIGRLTLLRDIHATTGYASIDHTNFMNDGILPSVTSADGTLYATGLYHDVTVAERWLKSVRGGIDLDRLAATGSDYSYWGVGLSAQAVIPIVDSVEGLIKGGCGYRNYDKFEFEPDRNEFLWRAGGELRKWFTPHFSAAAVANYQLFDSNNPLFAADRFIAGLTAQYVY
jgi:hypothetical protein